MLVPSKRTRLVSRVLKIFKLLRYYCNYSGGEGGCWKEGRKEERTDAAGSCFCHQSALPEEAKGVIVHSCHQMAPEEQQREQGPDDSHEQRVYKIITQNSKVQQNDNLSPSPTDEHKIIDS